MTSNPPKDTGPAIWTAREISLRCAFAGLLERSKMHRKAGDLRRAAISLRAACRVNEIALAETHRIFTKDSNRNR